MRIIGMASLLVVGLAGAGAALAHGSNNSPCDERSFAAAKLEKLSGRIGEAGQPGNGHHARGARLWLETSSGRVEVALGPADFVKAQAVQLAPGDQVDVSGWRMQMGHGDIFVASEVRRGNETLQLRDEKGTPAWAASMGGKGFGGADDPCPGMGEHSRHRGRDRDSR